MLHTFFSAALRATTFFLVEGGGCFCAGRWLDTGNELIAALIMRASCMQGMGAGLERLSKDRHLGGVHLLETRKWIRQLKLTILYTGRSIAL